MKNKKIAIVLGAAGFIGSHMIRRLHKYSSYSEIHAFDIKDINEFKFTNENSILEIYPRIHWSPEVDLSLIDNFHAIKVLLDINLKNDVDIEIFQFAADMGGAGYIFTGDNDFSIMINSASININLLETISLVFKYNQDKKNLLKVFYSSSACIYPKTNQVSNEYPICTEESAYPADPDSEYGWEKLFSERLYLTAKRNLGLDVKIARYHNIYGPNGAWNNGKEKAPAALTRKVLESIKNGTYTIDIWGSGQQTRSFLYIDDCIEGTLKLMYSDKTGPYNIGSEEMVSIDELANMCFMLNNASVEGRKNHINGPVGVNGRNSNNDNVTKDINWEPSVSLLEGLFILNKWMKSLI